MTTRPAARWLDRVASPARTAGLVAAALLLGAGGALAADADDSAGPAQAPVSCEDARNHGEYVSGVARSAAAGPGHGQAVRAAAQSDCGKSKSASKGEGKGKANGNGKGKGQAKRGDS